VPLSWFSFTLLKSAPPNDVQCRVRVVGRFYSVPATWTPDLRQPSFLHSPPPLNDELSPLPYLSYLRLMIRAREGIYVTSTHERVNARACIHILLVQSSSLFRSSVLFLGFTPCGLCLFFVPLQVPILPCLERLVSFQLYHHHHQLLLQVFRFPLYLVSRPYPSSMFCICILFSYIYTHSYIRIFDL